jgi:hypothetical protein
MSRTPKQIVRDFYRSDILEDNTVMERFIHPDIDLYWNSPIGLSIMKYSDMAKFFEEVRKSYVDLRVEISHLLSDENHITVRYKYYVRTMENPDEELGIAHFMAILEIKDDKIFRAYQVSQPVTDNDDTNVSYQRVKV